MAHIYDSKSSQGYAQLKEQFLELQEKNDYLIKGVESLKEEIQRREIDTKTAQGMVIGEDYSRQATLWKEKYMAEKQKHLRTLKDLNQVTEKLESCQAEVKHQVAVDPAQSQVQQEIQEDITALAIEKERMMNEVGKLREEAANPAHGNNFSSNQGKAQSDKEMLEKELQSMKFSFQEEQRKAVAKHIQFKAELNKMQTKHEQEIRQMYNQLRLQDMARKKLTDSLNLFTHKKTNKLESKDYLLKDIAAKDDIITMYRKEIGELRDKLEKAEVSNSRYQCEIQSLKLSQIKMEDTITHYLMLNAAGIDPQQDFSDLIRPNRDVDELERQKALYAFKYSTLVNDYMRIRHLAVQNGLKIPPRSGSPHPSHPEPLSDFFLGEEYNEHGNPVNKDYLVMKNQQQGDIDDDILEAKDMMARKKIRLAENYEVDPRPLDPSLICPYCVKQFRIGQTQNFRNHMESCSKK